MSQAAHYPHRVLSSCLVGLWAEVARLSTAEELRNILAHPTEPVAGSMLRFYPLAFCPGQDAPDLAIGMALLATV
jgi:hypothetical protein